MTKLEMPSLPPYGDFNRPAIAWSIAATACTANFLDIFQASMVLFGLSPIVEDLHFTPYDINWVIVAYTITFATFLLFAGQFADRWGVRNVFLVGAGTLLWSNLLSAFAPNQQALLAGRALAGVGAAFTVCGSLGLGKMAFCLMLTRKVCYWHLNHQSCLRTGKGSQCCAVFVCCLRTYCVSNGGHCRRFTDGYVTCRVLSVTFSSLLTYSCSIASGLALALLGVVYLRRFRILSRILPHSGLWRRDREEEFPV